VSIHFHLENEYRTLFVSDFHKKQEVASVSLSLLGNVPRPSQFPLAALIRQASSGQASSATIARITAYPFAR
jgi:hypothetical protein